MKRKPIPIDKFMVKPHRLWSEQGLLLTSGNFLEGHFNTMTVGWGSLGIMWRLPFVQVVVRPTRYTLEFMERYDTFTLCAFSKKYYAALQLLGTKSGRDGDKIAESGLTPTACVQIDAPCYLQARLVLECRKIYWDDMSKSHFLDTRIEERYPRQDYHRIYYGEVVAVFGERSYRA